MRFSRLIHALSVSTLLLFCFAMTTAMACTGIQLKTEDGNFVNGRTVEFGMPLDISGLVIPRNYAFKGTLPDGSAGLSYVSKYAVVGANTFGEPAIVDGVNEKGLSLGMFYFPGYAKYTDITPQNKSRALSPTEFPNWILTQFATVDEVKQALNTVVIAPTTPKNWPGLPPFHYVVYDKSGKSITIEPVDGQLKVYDNLVGVLTNSPTFDWQVTNISNYINLSPVNTPDRNVDGIKIQQFGQGSGLHGLPGDFTPPSRFIRAAIFSSTAVSSPNAQQAVLQAFHILNNFDIPAGSVRSINNNKVYPEYTLATTVKDPQNITYYYRTYDDQSIRMINLSSFDMNAKALSAISMKTNQAIIDMSQTAKPVS